MQLKDYRTRLIETKLDDYLSTFSAVCIEGPKYCGKTWTALSRAKSVAYLADPSNNFQTRAVAKLNPELVLQGTTPRLIDEWQEVPPLWDAVRFYADQTREKGLYILTGSATPNHKGILHSGTGRIAKVKMTTMSLYETGDSSGQVSLQDIFAEKTIDCLCNEVNLEQLIYLAVRGGWPGNIGISEKRCGNLASEYLQTVLQDDLYHLDDIDRDAVKMKSLITSLARNESTIVANTTLRRDMAAKDNVSISAETVTDYLLVLQRLFLINEQASYAPNLRSSRRALKAAKRHFIDPSLAVAALNANCAKLYNDLHTFGFIFESLCVHDLDIYAKCNDAELFHYRDAKNNEVDVIIELKDGRYGAFEIKLGAHQIDEAAQNLLKFQKIMQAESDKTPTILAVICGMSNYAYRRSDGVYVVPLTALKP